MSLLFGFQVCKLRASYEAVLQATFLEAGDQNIRRSSFDPSVLDIRSCKLFLIHVRMVKWNFAGLANKLYTTYAIVFKWSIEMVLFEMWMNAWLVYLLRSGFVRKQLTRLESRSLWEDILRHTSTNASCAATKQIAYSASVYAKNMHRLLFRNH